ncbi:MAG TPA: aldolase/citrate lyase family protein [Roseiarcus sp.]|nr:aldolase/citrate lyase family protein [Roseiarcus sp.]
MRALLIVPPGDRAAYAEALASGADAVVVDVASAAAGGHGPALYVRLPALDDPRAFDEMKAAAALRPRGVALATAGGADVQRLGARLAVEEAALGLEEGALGVLAFATESPQAIFGLASYRGASARLVGLVWSVAPLDAALGAVGGRSGPFRLARDMTLLAAKAAGVLAIDAAFVGDDLEGLRAEALAARADGFDGKVAVSAGQVGAIGAVFG